MPSLSLSKSTLSFTLSLSMSVGHELTGIVSDVKVVPQAEMVAET